MSAWAISGLKPSAFLAADGRNIRLRVDGRINMLLMAALESAGVIEGC